MKELPQLVDRLERWTGLDLRRGSSYAALERYLRLNLPAGDPGALTRYIEDLTTPHHPETVRLVDAITVCHSSFYRDPEQLAGIAAVLRSEPSRRAAVWVPACATGEDPYSLALVAESVGRPLTILATDINTRALAHAAAGVYGVWSVRDLPPAMALQRRADGRFEVPVRLRRVVTFARHNLMDVAPSSADGWDVIVCRNVLMYLTRPRVHELLQRLGAALRPGGYLFVGANDILDRPPPLLRFVRIGQRHVLWRPPTPAPAVSVMHTPATGVPILSGLPASSGPPASPGLPSASGLPAPSGMPASSRLPASSGLPAPSGMPASSITAPPVTARLAVPGRASAEPVPPAGVPIAPPRRADLSPARAHALLLEGDTPAALEVVLAVLDADPLNVEARLIAGIAYQLTGDALEASIALRAALVLAPDLWPAEMYLGFALFQLGDETGASHALRRGARLAATTERLPLSPSVATWLEGWRVDVIAMGRQRWARARTQPG